MNVLTRFKQLDIISILLLVPIPIFGLSLLLASSPALFTSQLIYMAIGLIVLLAAMHIDYFSLRSISWLFYAVAVGLIISVFIFGELTRGSLRWIDLGFFRLQPSEIAKPLLVLFFADLFARLDFRKLISTSVALVLFALPFLLVFKEPDLGSAMVLGFVFLGLLFLSNIRLRYFLVVLAIIVALMPVTWQFMHDYQRQRVVAFVNPDYDPLGKTYNISQAIIAIGSGQVVGRGLGQGTQTHLKFLPEHNTDFIFASLGEDLGFLGSVIMVLLYTLFFWRIIVQGERLPSRYASYILLGSGIVFLSQAFIHIGGNIGILPLTGITLPLVSYGGSSVVSSFLLLGMVFSVIRHRRSFTGFTHHN